jgi:hypothetical protein
VYINGQVSWANFRKDCIGCLCFGDMTGRTGTAYWMTQDLDCKTKGPGHWR